MSFKKDFKTSIESAADLLFQSRRAASQFQNNILFFVQAARIRKYFNLFFLFFFNFANILRLIGNWIIRRIHIRKGSGSECVSGKPKYRRTPVGMRRRSLQIGGTAQTLALRIAGYRGIGVSAMAPSILLGLHFAQRIGFVIRL